MSSTLPRWATVEGVADHLGMSTVTVRRMIAAGDLTGYRVGKRAIRIDLNEVDALLVPIPSAKSGGAR
ncbi:MAG: helix-turn-helix transcriptional regulator [Brachybacterium sp.]|uniref:helix-turn-helix transcriptional regulator n=1 Tax=Brachybacterium sp. TaxID=1891286 RepID=UPI003F8DB196